MWSIFFAEVGVITQFVKSNELSISSVICKMYSVISFFLPEFICPENLPKIKILIIKKKLIYHPRGQ